jgi:flagellar motor protein MotB
VSDLMLHAVLNMPAKIWHKDSTIDDMQRQSRYFKASKLIYQQADKIAELEEERDQILNSALDSESNFCDLKERIAELEKGYEKLRIAVSNAIPFMSGSAEEYADFRDAYDEATKQLKAKGGAE